MRDTETHLVIRELRHDALQGGFPAESRGDVADIFRDVGPSPAYCQYKSAVSVWKYSK